jgi:hypothetical protein
VARVNDSHYHAGELCLVFDKGTKLVESPGVLLPPLAFANRDAVSDVCQVFQGNTSIAVFGLCNNTLGNHMIHMGSKAFFLFGTLLEKSRRCLCIFSLKFGSKFGMPFSQPIDLPAGVNLAIRVSSDVDNTEVNAKELGWVTGRRLLNLTGLKEVEAAISINQVGFPAEMAKHFQLPVSGHKRNLQPAVKRPDGNKTVGCLPGEDAFIIGDASTLVKSSLNMPVNLVGIRHLCQNPNHNLCGKIEAAPKVIVKQVVKVILAKSLCFPGMVADIVGSIVHVFQRLQQCLVLFLSRCQFNLSYQFHKSIIAHTSRLDKKGGMGGFLCQINQAVSAA